MTATGRRTSGRCRTPGSGGRPSKTWTWLRGLAKHEDRETIQVQKARDKISGLLDQWGLELDAKRILIYSDTN